MRHFCLKLIFLLLCSIVTNHYASAQDLRLWYARPAEKWTDALPIGNGRIGAMIFGGPSKERLQFNEETLWTGGPRNYNREGASSYLAEIRKLLFEGKQAQAENLAGEKFMGVTSTAGNREAWVKEMRSLKGLSANPATIGFDDRKWKEMHIPTPEGWEAFGWQGLDGAVWLRTTFVLPSQWEGKDVWLDLGKIRDEDFTYLNGKLIGSMDGATQARKYKVKAENLKKGVNVLAIQVLNYYDKGGLVGYKDPGRKLLVYPEGESEATAISLTKSWKYYIQNDDPPAVARYQADYQPFGDLWLSFPGHDEFINYTRELDLKDAISRTRYSVHGVRYVREYFASAPDQAVVIHLTASKQGAISFEAALSSPHSHSSTRKIDRTTLALAVKVKDGVLRGESYLHVVASSGTVVVGNGKISVKKANAVTLYLTAGTSFRSYQDVSGDPSLACKKALSSVAEKSYSQVKKDHIEEYQHYFNTFSVSFGPDYKKGIPTDQRIERFGTSVDPALAALYMQYGRYLLISSSRPGTGPANLQGIWNDLLTPPWGSKYTTNINLEMNYWPAEALNLSPMTQPLMQMVSELSKAGSLTARAYYDAPGWVLHHNTDIWRGTAPINASNHGIWVAGGAWLCHHLWEHYLYTQDLTFLREQAYPIMKEAARFFNSFLIKDPRSGFLISSPSNSPEHGGLVAGPAMDHQIIRDLFKNCIAAAEKLHVDRAFADTLQLKYAQIAPNRIGRFGQLQEWMEDKDDTADTHRHVSHLWGVYPGSEISWDADSSLMRAARQSLLYRGDAGTGWSLAWKINLWSRFREGDHAFKMVKMLIGPAAKGGGSYVNLFDAHPPFQIDGNFGGASGISEMLLQSQSNYIELLPALPSALPEGVVHGICARGGFELDFSWQGGQLSQVTLLSKAGNNCTLKYREKEICFQTEKGNKYKFDGFLRPL